VSILTRSLTLVAVMAAGLAAVACGSSSDDAPSKAEFVKQADAICKKGNQDINQAAQKVFTTKSQPSRAEFEKFANDTLIPSVQKQVDGVDGLTPPKGDEDQVQKITDEANAAIAKAKQDPTLLESNKSDPFAKANKLATDYGLKVCGS
jgi:hypothetical protein